MVFNCSYTYSRRRSVFVSFEQVPSVIPQDFSFVSYALRYLHQMYRIKYTMTLGGK